MKSSSFHHFYVEIQYINITFDFRKWHNQSPKHLKKLMRRRRLVTESRCHLKLILSDTIAPLGFFVTLLSTLSQNSRAQFSPNAASLTVKKMSQIQSTTKKPKKPRCLNSPKVSFFSICVFFPEHLQFTKQQGKVDAISLTPVYHFNPLHRYIDIIRAITAESSPLHLTSSGTRTGNLWVLRQVTNH